MTSVLSYPMSDPFASTPHQYDATAARYPSPPLSPPITHPGSVPAGFTFTPPRASASAAQTSHTMPTPPASGKRAAHLSTPPLDEFGSYASDPTSTPRPSSHNTPTLPSPLPIPEPPVASSSTSHSGSAGSYAQAAQHPTRQRQRQSHNPSATLANSSPPKAEHLSDEYVLHPSVYTYKQAHPRRPMVGFGPYVLLQTLGEGEFGKVKLGVHTEYGVEVAIKLIRRGSLDDEVRASKVEREIDVLKMLKHPNIVRMFDVIDTEKYIGIVLEFAGGGELFDHILANRYLKERDAQKLFAQLISGVDYLHRKNIVHRDLKLENLLLDKHRNIIITDFGFANRFNHAADDLMATSCGSPCYAAPELVVSEGLYVGSAVDIWSCGVILYAMLSGYLPYDDDPANPDGDNINLLYKYIMSTKLNFPEHITQEARSLLQIMLVPNPEHRCTVQDIMDHSWLGGHQELFSRSVEMHEYIFQENMYRKSQVAKRELAERRKAQAEAKTAQRTFQRSQSSMPGTTVTASMLDGRRQRENRHHSALPGTTTMPEYLHNAGVRTPPLQAALRQSPPVQSQPTSTQSSPTREEQSSIEPAAEEDLTQSAPNLTVSPTPPAFSQPTSEGPTPSAVAVENEPLSEEVVAETASAKKAKTNRHTIQVEYDGEASYEKMKEALEAQHSTGQASTSTMPIAFRPLEPPVELDVEMTDALNAGPEQGSPESKATPAESQILTPIEASPPAVAIATVPEPATLSKRKTAEGDSEITKAASPSTPRQSTAGAPEEILVTPKAQPQPSASTPRQGGKRFDSMPAVTALGDSSKLNSAGLPKPPPRKERGRKGMSLDKFGLAKLLGQASASSVDVSRMPPPSAGAAAVSLQKQQEAQKAESTQSKRGSMRPQTADGSKSKRRTLQLMVNRSNSIRNSKSPATPSAPFSAPLTQRDMNPVRAEQVGSASGKVSPSLQVSPEGIQPQPTQSSPSIVTMDAAQQAPHNEPKTVSSSAAKKVMDWFRRKSIARDTLVNLKSAGIRSDSASSFVRVDESPVRPAPITGSTANLAMSSTSSIAHTAEGNPSIQITSTVPEETVAPAAAPADNAEETLAPAPTVPSPARAGATLRADTLPLATRSKSHNAPPTQGSSTAPLASTATLADPPVPRVRTVQDRVDESKMRVHTGLVDQSALSSKPPAEVMAEVLKVLLEMGMEVKRENEFRLRCTRVRRRKAGATTGLGLGSVMSIGSGGGPFTLMSNASVSRTDSRGLPIPQSPSGLLSSGGLKGMLLRRGSSYAGQAGQLPRTESEIQGLASPSAISVASPSLPGTPVLHEPLYGEHSVDVGDEVKFNVELCRIKNLPGLYLLNIKRLRGGVWSFKFIYQTLIERCETLTH